LFVVAPTILDLGRIVLNFILVLFVPFCGHIKIVKEK
jgi:hypothetical protein